MGKCLAVLNTKVCAATVHEPTTAAKPANSYSSRNDDERTRFSQPHPYSGQSHYSSQAPRCCTPAVYPVAAATAASRGASVTVEVMAGLIKSTALLKFLFARILNLRLYPVKHFVKCF